MTGDPLLLVLDYPGRRPEAAISDMGLEQRGFDCAYVLTAPLPTALTAAAYASELCARLASGNPFALVSYCGAAPLAIAMAGLLAGPGGAPLPIAFLDPMQTPPSDIVREYTTAAHQVEGRAAASERPPLLDVERLLAAPETLVQRIEADLRLRAKLALAAFGLDGADASGPTNTVVGMYVEWLTFHVAAHYEEPPPPNSRLIEVISHDHPAAVGWLGAAGAETVRVPCDRAGLAAHPAAREAVLDFLRRLEHKGIGHAG